MGIAKEQAALKNWYDLWFTPDKRAGYVAVTDFQKQYFYGMNDVPRLVKATEGKPKQFISINAFDVDFNEKAFSRETRRLKQIRNIAIDIDQYKLGMNIDEVLDELQVLILTKRIPEPNLVLTSRGVQLFYSIDGGAAPEMAWLASYITDQFIGKLQHVGADGNAKDMSRVMRVPNSINERNNTLVKPSIWNGTPYSLQELQAYCKPLDRFKTRKQKKSNVIHFPLNTKLLIAHRTNHARLTDLQKLIELRQGNFTYQRNTLLYIYSYHQALVMNTQKDLISIMRSVFKDVYSTADKPMSGREFERTVRSAYKDAETFFNHFQANGYTMTYKQNDGIIKPYSTDKIIKMLEITPDEQREMTTLRTAEVARGQHTDYMRSKRRQEGMRPMEEYNAERKKRTEIMKQVAKQLRDKGKSYNEIGKILRVTKGRVSQLLKGV